MLLRKNIVSTLAVVYLAATSQFVNSQEISETLQSRIAERFAQGDTPGLVYAIATNNRVIYERGLGVRDVETQRPATPDMLFRNGSTSKMLVASALIEILTEKGISQNTPIGDYVNGLGESVGKLTLHQLLTHTSGLADKADDFGLHDESALRINVESKSTEDFFTDPGEVFSYSNPGYDIAGHVLAYLSNSNFADALDEQLLKPAGMNRSMYRATEAMTYPFALPHRRNDQGEFEVIRPMPDNSAEWPSGLMYTTVGDLARFAIMFMNDGTGINGNRVLRIDTIEAVSRPYIERPGTPQAGSYGYGLGILERDEVIIWQHGGAIAGFTANITMLPAQKIAITVMVNSNAGGIVSDVTDIIVEELVGLDSPDDEQIFSQLPLSLAESLVGNYGQKDVRLSLVMSDGRLIAQNGSQDAIGEVQLVEGGLFAITSEGNPARFFWATIESDGSIQFIHTGSRANKRLSN